MSEVHKFYIKGHEVLIDKDKIELVLKYKWHISKSGENSFYVATNIPIGNKQKKLFLHRLILNSSSETNTLLVDHINRNSLDNRLCNLRLCTFSENARNSSSRKNSSSKYLGVSIRSKKYKKRIYAAQIKDFKKIIKLGYFANEIEAAKAYNEAAIKYHGEFANLNKFE